VTLYVTQKYCPTTFLKDYGSLIAESCGFIQWRLGATLNLIWHLMALGGRWFLNHPGCVLKDVDHLNVSPVEQYKTVFGRQRFLCPLKKLKGA